MTDRISPQAYFENGTTQPTNYLPWLIFGGICIVAITAMAIAIAYKK